ncbi:hypothetical protein HQ560_15660, partial [bacterium]|nr:hypothetical protein [bacterium]
MSRASRCVVVLAGLASMVLSGASAAGERAYVTWAVVPCGKAAAPGLADLVSVELQRIGGVELVEREQLKLVADELSLQAMLGAKDAASRARACKLLEADALVLLQEGGSGDRKHVKLLISESKYGARLRVSHIPYAVGTLDALVALIVSEVRDVLAKFPKGIERMVAVPAFVSRDLVHRYDRLQDGFAYIIQMAFASLPGTAVIEVEEAHHIRRERALSAEGPAKAPVPLVVYGEYQVAGAIVAETPRVNLWLSVRDAKSVLQSIEKEGLTLEDAAGFLRTDAVPLIVRAAPLGARPLLSSKELFTALNARADTFSKLGAWEQAFGLREAAVLVEPEDTEHRCLLVREYCRVIRSAFPKDIRCRRGEEPFESLCRKRVDKWLLCLEHLEYVIRSGQITRRPALEHTALVLRSVNPMMTRYSIHMAGAERAKREFLTAVYPLILNLP